MNRVLRILVVAFIIAILIIPVVSVPVGATATLNLYENLNTGGDGDSASIYGANYTAMQFTSNSTAHTVKNIRLMLERFGSPGTVTVSLRTAAAGVPNSSIDLVSTTINGNNLNVGYTWAEATFIDPYSLLPSTQYAIVVRAESGSATDYVKWWVDSGGGLASAISSASTDSGVSWTASVGGADCLFEVYGYSVLSIVSVKAFQGYITAPSITYPKGDLLITAEVINEYPPYANDPTYNPKQYFAVQLLDTTSTTVLASVPLVEWGDYPESIYLSATSVTPLTIGAPYVFRVQSLVTPALYVDYTLTSTDWCGDLTTMQWQPFDQWVKQTAQDMEIYYSFMAGSLISLVSGSNWTLTATGGAYFVEAIPGIMDKRPSLFQYAKSKPQFTLGTDKSVDAGKTSMQLDAEFQASVGTEVYNICTTFGNLFSLYPYVFAGYVIELLILIVVLIGLFAGEGAGALAIMIVAGVPLMFAGNYIHAIGVQWTLVFAAAMMFLFIRQFYFKST